MLHKNKKSYNHYLIQLKQKEKLTAQRLAELANVNLATLNSWLAKPESKKWRRLDKERFYLIKSRLFFSALSSFDKKMSVSNFLHSIAEVLNIAKKSALSGRPIAREELKYIRQASEMNQLIAGAIHDLIPADNEELLLLDSLKKDPITPNEMLEEDRYLDFLSTINCHEIINSYYIEKQTPFSLANKLNVPTRFVEKLIHEKNPIMQSKTHACANK